MKKAKVLLLMIVVGDMYSDLEELGLCYIASYLRENGCEVMISNVNGVNIDYGPFIDFSPDIIGFTMYALNKNAIIDASIQFRKHIPYAFLCIGGIEPTIHGEKIMEETPLFDFAIQGEGELSMLDLTRHINGNKEIVDIKGLIYRRDGKVVSNGGQQCFENLNDLPFPARDILIDKKLDIAQICSSRGCMARCSFCSSQLFKNKWRGRNAANIVDEIDQVKNTYGTDSFVFIDSSFEDPGYDYSRMKSIAQEIIDRKMNITYFADFRAEFSRKADDDLMKLLYKSGLICVLIGFESNSADDQKVYNKIATVEDNIRVIELLKKHNIVIKCGFINFNPYSTIKGLHDNIDFLEKYQFASNPGCLATVYIPFEGTTLYDRIKNDSLINRENSIGYNFADSRIYPLAEYISGFFYQNDEVAILTNKLKHFPLYYYIFLENFKKKVDKNENETAYKLVIDFENAHKDILNEKMVEVNSQIGRWFRELLELTETGWDPQKAYKITAKNLKLEHFNALIQDFDAMRLSLVRKLMRIGPEYTKYVAVLDSKWH